VTIPGQLSATFNTSKAFKGTEVSSIFLRNSASIFQTIRLFGGAIILVSIGVFLLYFFGFDGVSALRDGQLSNNPEAGLFSDFGILIMSLSGLFALLVGLKSRSFPFLALGVFCGMFAIDDALMLHERLGELEVNLFAFYAVIIIFVLIQFTRMNGGYIVWPITLAITAFAASVIVDTFWNPFFGVAELTQSAWPLYAIGFCLEDISKIGGIFLLSSFSVGSGISKLQLTSSGDNKEIR
jgi:hypothetical protein